MLMSRKKRAMPNKTLNLAIDGDILELAVMRRMYEMAKKEEYLKQHRFKVYQGKDGRWFTYVPDPRKETGRRQVVRHSKEKLEDAIVAAYKDLEDNPSIDISLGGSEISDKTGDTAVKRASMRARMKMIEQAAIAADPDIYAFIFKSVTQGISYEKLVASGIPCGRDYFYDRYRKFFWILDQIREKM